MTRRHVLLANLPRILLALSLVSVGILGRLSTDFGNHWDEQKLLSSLEQSVRSGTLLPRWYNYPSLSYDLSLLAAGPHLVTELVRSRRTHESLTAESFVRYLSEPAFLLRIRFLFFLLSILSGVSVYLLIRRLSGSAWIALFGGAMMISGSEFVYHARWVAPDCLLASLVSWCLLGQYQLLESDRPGRRILWTVISASLAGLCIGTKYPGGLVLVPFALAIAFSHKRTQASVSSTLLLATGGLLLCTAVFALTTPGCFLEPFRFIADLRWEVAHYRHGHGGHTVGAGWDHFFRLLRYLGTVAFSPNVVLAVAAAATAAVGAIHLAVKQTLRCAWFLSFPLLYGLHMSGQRVMIVRNYCVLLPFFSVLIGLGVFAAMRAFRNRRMLQIPIGTAATLLLAYNLVVVTRSSLGIYRPHPIAVTDAVAGRVVESPGVRFLLSPATLKCLGAESASVEARTVRTVDQADRVIFFSNEVVDWTLWPANTPGRYLTIWARVDEVNWDYYPNWVGFYRVLEVSAFDPELAPLISSVFETKAPGDGR